jgi:hypothetical protein
MSSGPTQQITALNRVDESENYRGERRPTEVHERIIETDFVGLLTIANNALDEFSWAVDDKQTEADITGLTIVGSFLTEDFQPHQSDLDIYLLTDEEYEHGEAFCRMLLDDQSAYRGQFYDTIPRAVSYVDPLGLAVAGAHRNFIRNPSITLKTDANTTKCL